MCLRRLLLSTSFAFLAMLSLAGDWPQWRGPLGTGVSDETGVPVTWSKTENIRWKVPLDGPGNSTPIVLGKRVFLTHAPEKSNLRGIMCFDRNSGEVLWKHQVEYPAHEPTHSTNPYCSSSAVTDGKCVVAWYGSAGVFCYDLDGNILWQKDLGKVEHVWGYGSSPIIVGNLVILNFGPGLNAFVIALDKENGEQVWRKDFPGQTSQTIEEFRGSWSTPVLMKDGSRFVLLLSLPERLRALDPKNGGEIWHAGGNSKLLYTSPLIAGDAGDIVVAMSGYTGPAIAVRGGGSGDVTETHRLWLHDMKNPQRVGSGVAVGKHVYILNEPGMAWCLDAETGEKKWEKRLGSKNSWSSMCYVEGRLYVPNMEGLTYVLEANPEECKVLAENDLGEQTRGSLAFSNGQIFQRTYKHLYCIEAK